MDHRTPGHDGLNLAIVAVTALAGLAVYPQLPAEMAVHFSAGGTPDNYLPRAVAGALLPVTMVLTMVVIRLAVRFDPPDHERLIAVTTAATLALLGAVHLFVLAWNLGHEVSFDPVLAGIAVWTVAVVDYALSRERRRRAA